MPLWHFEKEPFCNFAHIVFGKEWARKHLKYVKPEKVKEDMYMDAEMLVNNNMAAEMSDNNNIEVVNVKKAFMKNDCDLENDGSLSPVPEQEEEGQEAEEEVQETEKKVQEAEKEMQEANKKLQEAEEEVQETEQEMQEAEEEVHETEQEMQEAKKKLQETEKEVQEAEKEMQEAKKEMQEAEKEMQEAMKKLQEAEEKLQETEKEVQEAEKEMQEAKKKLQEAEEKLQETEKEVQEAEKKVQKAEKEMQEAKKKLQETEKEVQEVEEEGQIPQSMLSKQSSFVAPLPLPLFMLPQCGPDYFVDENSFFFADEHQTYQHLEVTIEVSRQLVRKVFRKQKPPVPPKRGEKAGCRRREKDTYEWWPSGIMIKDDFVRHKSL